jgi:DNA replication protein DnaC
MPVTDDPEVTAFFAKHCATPGAVIIVQIIGERGEQERMGVFSSLAQAQEWADTFDADDATAALFAPYIINEPDFGNIPTEAQH